MNPLSLLRCLALPALAFSLATSNVDLTEAEAKLLQGDPKVTDFVAFDITLYKSELQTENLGEIMFALFGETVPVTVAAFISASEMATFGYKDSTIHRVVKDMILQGGYLRKTAYKTYDQLHFDKYAKENFEILHNKPGRISMASTGGDTNGYSYFISMAPSTPFFDGKYVAFGQVVKGFDIIDRLNNLPVENEIPLEEIVITNARVISQSTPVVVYIGTAAREHLYFIYGCVGVLVLFVLFRMRRRRSLVDIKNLKM